VVYSAVLASTKATPDTVNQPSKEKYCYFLRSLQMFGSA